MRRGGWLLLAAGLLVVVFLALHAAGGRAATSALSGTEPEGLALGAAYALASLLLKAVAPVLALAWAIRLGLDRAWPDRPPGAAAPAPPGGAA